MPRRDTADNEDVVDIGDYSGSSSRLRRRSRDGVSMESASGRRERSHTPRRSGSSGRQGRERAGNASSDGDGRRKDEYSSRASPRHKDKRSGDQIPVGRPPPNPSPRQTATPNGDRSDGEIVTSEGEEMEEEDSPDVRIPGGSEARHGGEEGEEGELSDSLSMCSFVTWDGLPSAPGSGDYLDVASESDAESMSDPEEYPDSDTDPDTKPQQFAMEEEVPLRALANLYPPCIRAIVKASECQDPGTLHIVTCTGASIGRESGKALTLVIPDPDISKCHCNVAYNYDSGQYEVTDMASENGTFLNHKRLSRAVPHTVTHGDDLRLGGTTLGVHIHPGAETCESCEPGVVQASLQAPKPEVVILSKEQKDRLRKKQLKSIKKKYGLENMAYVENASAVKNPKYMDLAGHRRRTVGSDHPHQPDAAPASVHQPIAEENKGHKLLAKMGWKEGQSLGKAEQGIKEPIQVKLRAKTSAGLGAFAASDRSLDHVAELQRTSRWVKTQERFSQLPAVCPTDPASQAGTDPPAAQPQVNPTKKSSKTS